VDDAGVSIAMVVKPDRHALVESACECAMCPPRWMRRRGRSKRFSEEVTLVAALARESAFARPGMVEQHRGYLAALTEAAEALVARSSPDDPSRSDPGLSLLMFSAELAAAVQPDEYRDELSAALVAECERAVTAATCAAAECLLGLEETIQLLSAVAVASTLPPDLEF
jgi:hypothetical protein